MANIVPKVCIVTAFSGKHFCFYEYRRGIGNIVKTSPDISHSFVMYDNAGPSFLKRLTAIKTCLEGNGIPVVYYKDTSPVAVADRYKKMYSIYSKCLADLIPADTDFVLFVEDDVSCMIRGVTRKLLSSFNANTAMVTANVLQRNRTVGSHFPLSWNYENQKMTRKELRISGVEESASCSQSFTMVRYSVLKNIGLQESYGEINGVDRAFGLKAGESGYKTLTDWSLLCKHYYLTRDKILKFADPNIEYEKQRRLKTVKRIASPLFIKLKEKANDQGTVVPA